MAQKTVVESHSASRIISSNNSQSTAGLASVTLMLLGKTGAGKSSLGNAILSLSGENAFTVTGGLLPNPVYTAVAREARVHDRQVKVVDTPGLMDTSPDGAKRALEGICHAISHCCEGVDAFIIVLRLDVRLTDEEWRTVDKLEELFGEQLWNHAIVVFTHGDCIGNDSMKFEKQIEATRNQLPQMDKLLSKLKTKQILVDAREDHQESVVAKQILNLLREVDMTLTSVTKKKKYTNDIFAAVRVSLCTKENEDHVKQLEAARLEIAKLKERNSQLVSVRAEDQQRIESLEQTVAEVLHWSECARQQAAKKLADLMMKNRCTIL